MAYCTLEDAWGPDYKSFLSPASLSPDWLSKCRQPSHTRPGNPATGFPSEKERRFHYSDMDEDGMFLENFSGGGGCGSGGTKKYVKRASHRTPPPPFGGTGTGTSGTGTSGTGGTSDEDEDLLLDHDEFNIPLHLEAPEAIDPGMDDYYKLVNSQFDSDTINSYRFPFQDTNYAEEVQFDNLNNRECNKVFPAKVKRHLKKCKYCRKKMKNWLQEFGELIEDTIIDGPKKAIEPVKEGVKQLFPVQFRGYVDLIFFIALGIFLIFVLDTFVRLGKSFRK